MCSHNFSTILPPSFLHRSSLVPHPAASPKKGSLERPEGGAMTQTTVDEHMSAEHVLPPPPAMDSEPGWTAELLVDDPNASLRDLARRGALGLGLSAFYGLALGARQGGKQLLVHALGVPLGLLLVVLVGAPSMFVFLSMCR